MSIQQIIAQIAKNNGVTQDEVEKELLKATNFVTNPKDPTVIEKINTFLNKDTSLSLEDVIKYCVIQFFLKTN